MGASNSNDKMKKRFDPKPKICEQNEIEISFNETIIFSTRT